MTKAQRLEHFRALYPQLHITGVKTMTSEQVKNFSWYGYTTIEEVYKRPSEAKRYIWDKLMRLYNPIEVYGVNGSSQTFSVLLRAENGVVMHITKGNNYLVEIV